MSNNGKSKTRDAIISVVFLLWFVASIVGMLYVAKTGKTALLLALFGQYFLVFGIIGLVSIISDEGFKLRHVPILIFPLVGAGAIAGGFIIQYGSEEFKDKCGALYILITITGSTISLVMTYIQMVYILQWDKITSCT